MNVKDNLRRCISLLRNCKPKKNLRGTQFEKRIVFGMEVDTFIANVKVCNAILNNQSVLSKDYLLGDEYAEYLVNRSPLWGDYKLYPVDSIEYRARFVNLLLTYLASNIYDILADEVVFLNGHEKVTDKLKLLRQLIDCLIDLIGGVIKNDYHKQLFRLYDLLLPIRRKEAILKMSSREIDNLKNLIKLDVLSGRKPEDYIVVQNLCSLTYLMSTGDRNMRSRILVSESVRIRNKNEMYEVVDALGTSIINYKKVFDDRFTVLYKLYLFALPEIRSKFDDINFNESISEGCRALYFIAFLINDKNITKLVKRIVS